MIDNADEAVSQAIKIAILQTATSLSGAALPMKVRTLCVHGESPDAVELLRLTRSSLEGAGIRIMAP